MMMTITNTYTGADIFYCWSNAATGFVPAALLLLVVVDDVGVSSPAQPSNPTQSRLTENGIRHTIHDTQYTALVPAALLLTRVPAAAAAVAGALVLVLVPVLAVRPEIVALIG